MERQKAPSDLQSPKCRDTGPAEERLPRVTLQAFLTAHPPPKDLVSGWDVLSSQLLPEPV